MSNDGYVALAVCVVFVGILIAGAIDKMVDVENAAVAHSIIVQANDCYEQGKRAALVEMPDVVECRE